MTAATLDPVVLHALSRLYRFHYLSARADQRMMYRAAFDDPSWRRTSRWAAWRDVTRSAAVWVAQEVAAGRDPAPWMVDAYRAAAARAESYLVV